MIISHTRKTHISIGGHFMFKVSFYQQTSSLIYNTLLHGVSAKAATPLAWAGTQILMQEALVQDFPQNTACQRLESRD